MYEFKHSQRLALAHLVLINVQLEPLQRFLDLSCATAISCSHFRKERLGHVAVPLSVQHRGAQAVPGLPVTGLL
jgi:hypothetical protein